MQPNGALGVTVKRPAEAGGTEKVKVLEREEEEEGMRATMAGTVGSAG